MRDPQQAQGTPWELDAHVLSHALRLRWTVISRLLGLIARI